MFIGYLWIVFVRVHKAGAIGLLQPDQPNSSKQAHYYMGHFIVILLVVQVIVSMN
jgi:hypothetical protein